MPKKPDTEESLRRREAQIPRLAKVAVKRAYLRALEAGEAVLIADEGTLYEVTREGRRPVKKLAPKTTVRRGTIIKLS